MGKPLYVVVGHYCPTDSNPEALIGAAVFGTIEPGIQAAIFKTRELAEGALPWYPDGVIVEEGMKVTPS